MAFNAPASLSVSPNVNTALTVFRQATYPVWADQTLQYAYQTGYRTVEGVMNSGGQSLQFTMRPAVGAWYATDHGATFFAGVSGTPTASAGQPPYPIFGADRGLPGPEYTYVPPQASLYISVCASSALAGSTAVSVEMEWWRSPGETADPSPTTVIIDTGSRCGSTLWGTVLQGQWVRPRAVTVAVAPAQPTGLTGFSVSLLIMSGTASFAASSSSGGLYTLTPTSVVSHFPLVLPVEFTNSALPWYATRVTAAALLGTNVTQVLNKGGTVLGGRVSPAVQNAWSVAYSYINGLHPAEKAYLPLETGVYTYCPPSTDLVFFGDYTLNTAYAEAAPIFLLSNDALYNKIYLTAPVQSTMACTCTWHIEFRTSSSLFQVGLSGMTLEALHQAQLVLAESGFFFENVEHKQLLSKVVALAKKYVPDAVSVINPSAGKMLQSIVSRMSSKGKKDVKPKPGPSKPKATSAKASGITTSKGEKGKKNGKKKK